MQSTLIEKLVFDLGYACGDNQAATIPTLVTDMILSLNVIQVPVYLADKWREKTKFESKETFKENLKWYKENLEKVYLPHEVSYTTLFDKEYSKYKDIYIKGYNMALWDCDYSHYKCVNVVEETYGNGRYSYYKAILRTEYFEELINN